eukprot:jgi/Ulvmu1/11647/UM008_0051.1
MGSQTADSMPRKLSLKHHIALLLAATLHAGQPAAARFTSKPRPCDFPDEPTFPERPSCPPTTLTKDDAVAMAWRFAPEIRFHPLEDAFLVDPAEWFADAVISAPRSLLAGASGRSCAAGSDRCAVPTAQWPRLMRSPEWNVSSSDTDFVSAASASVIQNSAASMDRKRALIAGAPFDAAGRSAAPLTYSLTEAQGGAAWLFAFHLFYGWNGCSNQAFALPLPGRTVVDVEEYYLCPVGAHEMDLEYVGVYVCPGDLETMGASGAGSERSTPSAQRRGPPGSRAAAGSARDGDDGMDVRAAIRRVQYSQHGRRDEMDCDAGECPFESDAHSASKLVAYAGLFSHALYPRPSILWVYAQGDVRSLDIPASVAGLVNTLLGREGREGIFIADRTAGTAAAGRRWVAAASNVRRLPPLAEVDAGSRDAWAAFPGSWGIDDLAAPLFAITCLSQVKNIMMGHETQGQCPQSHPAYQAVADATRAVDAADTFEAIDLEASQDEPQSSSSRRTGPLFQGYSSAWPRERGAFLWTDAEEPSLKCPAS